MQVQQIIKASADVLTITRLSAGDVYKRVDTTGYNGEPVLRFGVVQDVMNNGEDAAVTALEYERDYTEGVKATLRVFTGAKPAAIYPATPDEVRAHLDDLEAGAERNLREAREKVRKAEEALDAVHQIRVDADALTAPETSGVLDAVAVEE